MIVVQDIGGLGTFYQRIEGNPVIDSLDGEVRAPLQVILHETWSYDERAKFGIYIVEPFAIPPGKVPIGSPNYVKRGGIVVEEYVVMDAPTSPPEVSYDPEARLKSIEARIAALEAKQ